MKENLFSYGTLQNENVQLKLFGRLLNGAKDILSGYKIFSIEIKDESFLSNGENKFQMTLVRSENDADFVVGTFFEISDAELLLADEYEPDNYNRIEVALESGKNAWVYVADQN